MINILCLYPVDETTNFLQPIFDYLLTQESAICLRFSSKEEDVKAAIEAISSSEKNTVVIFLGHGSSNCLYINDEIPFVNETKFSLFVDKSIFLLACRSAEFIKKNQAVELRDSIGFGNMITDWSEIMAERNFDANAYPDIDEEVVSLYKYNLVNSILSGIRNTLICQQNFYYLFLQIRLYLNKQIAHFLIQKPINNYRVVADLLYKTKIEMNLIN